MTRTSVSLIILSLALSLPLGCEPPEREPPELIAITSPPSKPVSADIKISGRVESTRRLQSVRINGSPVTSKTDNFDSWELEISITELRNLAFGEQNDDDSDSEFGYARLEVTASDVFDVTTELTVLEIPVARDPTAQPEGVLSVSPTLPQPKRWAADASLCYAPSDGSELVDVRVTSTSARDLGLLVAVAPTRGVMVPSAVTGLPLQNVDGTTAIDLALQVSDNLDGSVTMTATAGTTTSKSPALLLTGPPRFGGAPPQIAAGEPVLISVTTLGALDWCRAETTSSGTVVTLDVDGGVDLLAGAHEFPTASSCDQFEGILVEFAADALQFSTVQLTCSDVFGQTASRLVTLMPEDEDEGGDGDGDGDGDNP